MYCMNVCVCTMNCFNSNISYVQCHNIIYSAMTLLCYILYIMVLELYPISLALVIYHRAASVENVRLVAQSECFWGVHQH